MPIEPFNAKAIAKYQCRYCNEIFTKEEEFMQPKEDYGITHLQLFNEKTIHNCSERKEGLAYLIGCEY